jgi:uncharacterized protein
MAAAKVPAIRAVVADSPYASLDWLARNQFEAFSSFPSWLAPLVVYAGGLQAGADPRHIAPVERVAQISPRPLLLIHGAEDHLVRVENTYLLAEAAQPPTTVWVLPGVPHTAAYSTHPTEFLTRLTTFFDTALLAE